jgi:hypothetical protein
MRAHEEYELDGAIEDVRSLIGPETPRLSDEQVKEIATQAMHNLSKNDSYFEAYWMSVQYTLDDYIDNGVHSNRLYKKIKCGIRFPCPDNYYAVFVDRIEDENLTRAIFGLTHEEITSLLDAYAITMGTHSDYGVYPRLTKSPRNTNFCDITDIWIPKWFPYVAFKDSNYDFSHVSLWGFYRHIQLLTGYNINSLMSRCLLKAGANETTLQRIFNMDIGYGYSTKVTDRIVNED